MAEAAPDLLECEVRRPQTASLALVALLVVKAMSARRDSRALRRATEVWAWKVTKVWLAKRERLANLATRDAVAATADEVPRVCLVDRVAQADSAARVKTGSRAGRACQAATAMTVGTVSPGRKENLGSEVRPETVDRLAASMTALLVLRATPELLASKVPPVSRDTEAHLARQVMNGSGLPR